MTQYPSVITRQGGTNNVYSQQTFKDRLSLIRLHLRRKVCDFYKKKVLNYVDLVFNWVESYISQRSWPALYSVYEFLDSIHLYEGRGHHIGFFTKQSDYYTFCDMIYSMILTSVNNVPIRRDGISHHRRRVTQSNARLAQRIHQPLDYSYYGPSRNDTITNHRSTPSNVACGNPANSIHEITKRYAKVKNSATARDMNASLLLNSSNDLNKKSLGVTSDNTNMKNSSESSSDDSTGSEKNIKERNDSVNKDHWSHIDPCSSNSSNFSNSSNSSSNSSSNDSSLLNESPFVSPTKKRNYNQP